MLISCYGGLYATTDLEDFSRDEISERLFSELRYKDGLRDCFVSLQWNRSFTVFHRVFEE